jgi:hypothetical protein
VFLTSFKIQQIIECIDKKRWIILVCYLKQIIVIITRFCSLYILAPSIYGTGKLRSALDIARWRLITSFTMGEIGSIRLLCLLTLGSQSGNPPLIVLLQVRPATTHGKHFKGHLLVGEFSAFQLRTC